MLHHTPLISTIVAGIGLAFLFGVLANRLRVPPLVGYLLAGIFVGPFTPGFVADQSLANQLAELGVILLMFGVGLHFSIKDLLSVSAIAVPGAIVQIAVATVLGLGIGMLMGWTIPAGLMFGLALSTASTIVLLRALQEQRLIDTRRGRIAVGWLIVEDIAMVLALVMLPSLASLVNGPSGAGEQDWIAARLDLGLPGILAVTLAKVVAFVAFMLVVGRRVIPWGLHIVAHMGSRELFRMAVLAIALCVAFGAAQLFGVSLALGAFFAGMILSESELSHQAAQETLPLRDAFSVLFFVSVGMLFDPSILWHHPLPVLSVLFIILIGKSVVAFLIVLAFHYPVRTALTISASLAQIGEFSFILAELGVRLELMPEQARTFILAGAILSILCNPLMFAAIDFLDEKIEGKKPPQPGAAEETPAAAPAAAAAPDAKSVDKEKDLHVTEQEDHIILVGFGRVGALVGEALRERGSSFVAIEEADKVVERLRAKEIEVVVGNAANLEVLKAANLARARCLVLAIPHAFEAGQVAQQARTMNPGCRIIACTYSDAETEHLVNLGATYVVMGEKEIARGITQYLFTDVMASDGGGMRMSAAEPEGQAESA